MVKKTLTLDEIDALGRFAADNGRNWKAALRAAWEKHNYAGVPRGDVATLASLRNSSRFGAAGLIRYRVTDAGGDP